MFNNSSIYLVGLSETEKNPSHLRRVFLGDVLFIIMGGDKVYKLLLIHYMKINTMSIVKT